MPVRVVESEYKTDGSQKATVVLQADERGELEGPRVKTQALEYARSKNFPVSGLAGVPQIYPVNSAGVMSEAMLHGKEKVSGYRMEVEISAGAKAGW
jgi:hypothetical protein